MDLFDHDRRDESLRDESLGEGVYLLGGFALPWVDQIVPEIEKIAEKAPFRHLLTPGGKAMSAAMTNCGSVGWVSDRRGYRYEGRDPQSGKPWPNMPEIFLDLAVTTAKRVGFDGFAPEACLINRYVPGTKMSLHQDRDEADMSAPIVSVSLGLPATFLWGGSERASPVRKVLLRHGDVVVFGGASRLNFHGIAPLKAGDHEVMGARRINLTFRKVAK